MPNYVGNKLSIEGSYEERDKFIKEMIIKDRLELANIIPCEYNYDDPIKYWGTKWGCFNVRVTHDENDTSVNFQTAWYPYNETVQKVMSKIYPKLKFKLIYAEMGMEICGYYESEGNLFKSEEIKLIVNYSCEQHDDCAGCDDCVSTLDPSQEMYQEVYDASG